MGKGDLMDPNAMAGINTHATILDSLKGKKGKIIDLGAGEGALSEALVQHGFEVYACDIDSNNFKASGVVFDVVDLNEKFPYSEGEFDYVAAVEVIEHLENPRHFIREIHRVLKDGGWLSLSFLLRGNLIYFTQKEYSSNRHITPLKLQDIENIFSEIGFSIKRIDFNAGKLPIPKIRHKLPLFAKTFRNIMLGESLIVWAQKVKM
jgi:SAM-dependent methyltransferase